MSLNDLGNKWQDVKRWWLGEFYQPPTTQQAFPAQAVKTAAIGSGRVLAGRDRTTGQLLWYEGLGNVVTVAPARSGKLISSIGPNIFFHDGSLLAVDPKGEIAHAFARLRAEGYKQPTYFLNPARMNGLPCHGFNPLTWLDPDSDMLASDAAMIADTLIAHEGGNNAHWSDEASNLVRTLLLYCAFDPRVGAESRSLVGVREMLQFGPDDVLKALTTSPVPMVREGGDMLKAKSENELRSVFSTASRNTHFLGDKGIQRVLGQHDFDLADLKRSRISVFLLIPLQMLEAWAKWLRLMLRLAFRAMMRHDIKTPEVQAWFVLDEVKAIGQLTDVEIAAGLMPGQGLRLHLVVQSVAQLSDLYPSVYRDLFNNSGLVQAFNVSDPKEALFFQEMMAQRIGGVGAGGMAHYQPMERADEIMYRHPELALVRRQGSAPQWVEKVGYVTTPKIAVAPEIQNHPYYPLVNTDRL